MSAPTTNNILKTLKNNSLFTISILIIFLIAGLLRISLANINQYSNDQHFMVIKIIQNQHIIPDRNTPKCKQCYHPKLYYLIASKLIQQLPPSQSTQITDIKERHAIQQLNALFGMLTLIIIFIFLINYDTLSLTIISLTFALTALNPRFISINIQNTNDSLIILLSTLTIYFLYSFLNNKKFLTLFLASLFSTLALLTKNSGIVILVGSIIILSIFLFAHFKKIKYHNKYIVAIIFFIVINCMGAIFLGPYYDNYKDTGNFLAINKPKSPPVNFFKKTYPEEKIGIISIVSGYFTFRWNNLLKHPFIDRPQKNKDQIHTSNYAIPEKTLNQTSFWTELYARTNFIQHESHPKQWKNKTGKSFRIGRLTYLFALLPLIIFIVGLIIKTQQFINGCVYNGLKFAILQIDWIFLFFLMIFVLALIKFTMDYRTFSSIKIIYILPAILPATAIFSSGLRYLFKKINSFQNYKHFLLSGIILSLITLLIIYISDSLLLLETLQKINYH